MIQVKNLTKFYKTGKGVSTRALDGVSLSFGDSGLVFILGKSGCGKTTLLNLLGGLIRPTEGEVIFNSQSSKNFKEGDFDKFRNKHVGFVFQEYNLIDGYKVGANVALACELQGKKPDRQTVEDILRRLELTDEEGNTFYDRRISELSGGQKQRVAIARALIKNPDIILADEPTGALDSKSGEQLYTLLKELSKERLIIVVTHDREAAQNFGDRIIELADGRVESDSNPFTEECAAVSSVPATENTKVKTDLPFVRALSMGAAGLRKFPVRLSISVILSFLCLVVFGFTLCLSFHDILTTEIKTLYSREYSLIAVDLYAPDEKQVNSIAAFNGLDKPALVCQSSISCYEYWEMPSPTDLHNPYVNFAMFGSHCVGLDSENAEEFANLTPDGRFIDKSLCRYPEAADEIAITDVKADLFIRFGYKTEEGEIIKISTPDDLIGKKIYQFTITGVYSTDMSADYFRQYDVDNYKNVDIFGNLKESPADKYFSGANNCSAISFIYTSSEFTESIFDSSSGRYLLKLSGDFDKDYSFLKSLGVYQKEPGRDWYIATMDSPCWNIIEPLTILDSINIAFYLVPAIVFGVIAVLMTLNVLLTNLDSRNKEMGILRAMGAGKKSVMSICLSESLILAVSNFILSLAGLGILTAILNAAFYCKLIIMDIKVVAIMLACSVGIAAIATLFTMIKIFKSKPIDIINKS